MNDSVRVTLHAKDGTDFNIEGSLDYVTSTIVGIVDLSDDGETLTIEQVIPANQGPKITSTKDLGSE